MKFVGPKQVAGNFYERLNLETKPVYFVPECYARSLVRVDLFAGVEDQITLEPDPDIKAALFSWALMQSARRKTNAPERTNELATIASLLRSGELIVSDIHDVDFMDGVLSGKPLSSPSGSAFSSDKELARRQWRVAVKSGWLDSQREEQQREREIQRDELRAVEQRIKALDPHALSMPDDETLFVNDLVTYKEARTANTAEQYGFWIFQAGYTKKQKLGAIEKVLTHLMGDETAKQTAGAITNEDVAILKQGNLGRVVHKHLVLFERICRDSQAFCQKSSQSFQSR